MRDALGILALLALAAALVAGVWITSLPLRELLGWTR